jgi:hypothetical protein
MNLARKSYFEMIEYSCFYKRPIRTDNVAKELPEYDLFISAFNSSDRVKTVFTEVRAQTKIWLLHPEYQYSPLEEPIGFSIVKPHSSDERLQVDALLAEMGDVRGKSICIDITGFMRHVLAFLIAKLAYSGLREFSALYSEPMYYLKQEQTSFSTTTSGVVRPVRGMAGINSSTSTDFLIIAVGYDHKLISEVANHKDNSIVYPVFAFPSLSPDMYQQSAIRSANSGDVAISPEWISNRKFAPANDPFSTAGVVRDIISDIDKRFSSANIYLSPMSTKVQVLGFSIYWLLEGRSRGGVSLILPECVSYSRETSVGIKRLWCYTIETAI